MLWRWDGFVRGWGATKRGAGIHSSRREQGMRAALPINDPRETERDVTSEMKAIRTNDRREFLQLVP